MRVVPYISDTDVRADEIKLQLKPPNVLTILHDHTILAMIIYPMNQFIFSIVSFRNLVQIKLKCFYKL